MVTVMASLHGFGEFLGGASKTCIELVDRIAEECGIENRRALTGEEAKPTSQNDVNQALQQITKPIAVYWHPERLCVVIVNVDQQRVGVKSASLYDLVDGPSDDIAVLVSG